MLTKWLVSDGVCGLKCFVGLGNTSKKHEMKVVDCPEGKFYVCVKMFGGGMGDQIRRYCEAIPREVVNLSVSSSSNMSVHFLQDYKDLLEKEDLKERDAVDGVDPACYETVHNGREVRVCICTGDKCNASSRLPTLSWATFGLILATALTTK